MHRSDLRRLVPARRMTSSLLALVAAPLVLGLALVCIREPMRVTLPIFGALIPFGGGLSVGSSRFGSISSIIGILLAVGLLLQLATVRRGAVRLHPTVPTWLLLLGYATATTLWSVDAAKTISGCLVLFSLIVVYALVAVSHVDWIVLRRIQNGVLVGGVAATSYGLYQLLVLGGFPSDSGSEGPAPDGRFGNDLLGPNNEAIALLLPLVIALSRAVTIPEWRKRQPYLAVSALLFVGILMTGSRGGLLSTVVTLVVLALTVPRGRAALLSYCAVGAAVGAAVFLFTPGGLAERTVETTSSSGRTSIWQVGLAACPEYCLTGSGWGTFPDVYADTQASVPGAKVLVGPSGAYEPHNLWLLAAIELGLPGLALLAAGLLLSLREGIRLPGIIRGPPLSALAGTIFAANFLSNLEFKFFWMALIMVAVCRNLTEANARPSIPVPVRGAMAVPSTPSRRRGADVEQLAGSGWGEHTGRHAPAVSGPTTRRPAPARPGSSPPAVGPRGPRPVPIPVVTGMPAGEAAELVEAAGFLVVLTEDVSEEVPAGQVISQDRVGVGAPGQQVTLLVAGESRIVPVPTAFLRDTARAEAVLRAAGFDVHIEEAFGGVVEDIVVRQSPSSGTPMPRGSTVTLYIV